MRRKSVLVTLALVGFMAPAGVAAQPSEELHCFSVHEVTMDPGLSVQGTSGSAHGDGGTMECYGPVNGRTPTGVGTYDYEESRYGTEGPDTCQDGGEGWGVFRASVPTAEGRQELNSPFTFTFGDFTSNPGFVSGEFSGDGVRGAFKVTPLEGDCVSKPITRIRVHADFWFAKSFFTR